jgi:hypothetical protein
MSPTAQRILGFTQKLKKQKINKKQSKTEENPGFLFLVFLGVVFFWYFFGDSVFDFGFYHVFFFYN